MNSCIVHIGPRLFMDQYFAVPKSPKNVIPPPLTPGGEKLAPTALIETRANKSKSRRLPENNLKKVVCISTGCGTHIEVKPDVKP